MGSWHGTVPKQVWRTSEEDNDLFVLLCEKDREPPQKREVPKRKKKKKAQTKIKKKYIKGSPFFTVDDRITVRPSQTKKNNKNKEAEEEVDRSSKNNHKSSSVDSKHNISFAIFIFLSPPK